MQDPQVQQMASLIKTMGQTGNPLDLMNKLAGQNPAFGQIQSLANAAGGDYKAAFFNAAKSQGLTDEQISSMVSQLSQLFSKV